MFAVIFMDAFLAENSTQGASILQADVVDLFVAVMLFSKAEGLFFRGLVLLPLTHNNEVNII